MQYEGLLRAVKRFLNGHECCGELQRPFIPDLYAILLKSVKGGSDFYRMIAYASDIYIKSQDKWYDELGCNNLKRKLIINYLSVSI